MAYIPNNYTEQGGDKTVIGGEILINGTLSVGEGATVPVITAAAQATVLGGVKAATKGAGDTVEAKIDGTSKKLFVPTYPVAPVAAHQANSAASTVELLVADHNALIAKLIAAGIMAAE